MGLNCLYMINWLLSTFCLFVWRCLANLKKLGCNSARSTLGIPSGASGRCRSSQLPDVISFSWVSGEDKAATNGHQLGRRPDWLYALVGTSVATGQVRSGQGYFCLTSDLTGSGNLRFCWPKAWPDMTQQVRPSRVGSEYFGSDPGSTKGI